MLTPDSCVVTHCVRDLQQKWHAFWKVILLLWNSNFDKAITNRSEPPKHSKYYQPSFWRELHHCQGRNLLLTSVFSPSFQLKYQVLFACTEMAIGQEFFTHQWTVKSTLSSWCILLVRCRAVTRLKLTEVVIIPTISKPFSQTRKTNVLFPEDHIPGSGYSLPGFAQNSPELVLTFTTPMVVTAGQEYRVWFLEDLMASSYEHANNPEPSCMKVILSFSQ